MATTIASRTMRLVRSTLARWVTVGLTARAGCRACCAATGRSPRESAEADGLRARGHVARGVGGLDLQQAGKALLLARGGAQGAARAQRDGDLAGGGAVDVPPREPDGPAAEALLGQAPVQGDAQLGRL